MVRSYIAELRSHEVSTLENLEIQIRIHNNFDSNMQANKQLNDILVIS